MAKPSPSAGVSELAAIGEAIRRRRQVLGLSQEALALAAGIDRSYMGGIERGEHNFAMVNLIKISASLSASPSDVLKDAAL